MEGRTVTTILVVDDDDLLRSSLSRDLALQGFEVHVASSVESAETVLRARSIDVLLADLRMNGRDGIDLLGTAREISGRTRAVLMSAYASARDHQTAHELGAVQVLCKPFTPRELIEAIRQAAECEVGFRGSFHGLSLVDMLQMFHFGRRSICVTVAGRPAAVIHVRDGEIVHAARGDLAGEEALFAILSASSGSIRTSVLDSSEQSVGRPFQELLLDSMRAMDEAARADEREPTFSLPPPGEKHALAADPFERLRAAASRVATDAVFAAVSRTSPEVVSIQGHLPNEELAANVRVLAADVARLSESWTRIEIVAPDVAVTVVAEPGSDWLLVYGDALVGRYAAMRFRADVQRILAAGEP
jgi:CheY-like chemotaxis protein